MGLRPLEMFTLTVRVLLYTSECKVGPRTERVNPFTPSFRNCLLLFFIYKKLKLLTQIQDANKRKTLIFKVVVHCTATVG